MAYRQANNIRITTQRPLDDKYLNGMVPYASVEEACTKIPIDERSNGLPVKIGDTEYWWKAGLADSNLVEKAGGGISIGTSYVVDVKRDFHAIGDGNSHPLSERYGTLNAARTKYPCATALTDEIDWAALQTAANEVLYFNNFNVGEVYCPSGHYVTNKTVHLGYGFQEEGFKTVIFSGARGGVGLRGDSIIRCTNKNVQAINIQGARASIIRDILVLGNLGSATDPFATFSTPTTFITGAPAFWDKRYAPNAAITIDAFCGTKPAGTDNNAPYDDIYFPTNVLTAIGASSYQYGKRFTSVVSFENVRVSKFVAGFVINPSPVGSQNDYISFHKCYGESLVYGISVGAPNARQINGYDCVFQFTHSVLNSKKHGQQQGTFGTFSGCEFSYVWQWMDISSDYHSNYRFSGVYGEGLGRIGITGSNGAGCKGVTFDDCAFSFHQTYSAAITTHKNFYQTILIGRYSTFKNCHFSDFGLCVIRGSADFEGCTINPRIMPNDIGFPAAGSTLPEWYINFVRYTGGIVCVNGSKTGRKNGLVLHNPYGFTAPNATVISGNYDEVQNFDANFDSYRYVTDITKYISTNSNNAFQQATGKRAIVFGGISGVQINQLSPFTLTGRTLSFQLTTNFSNLRYFGIGSVLYLEDANSVIMIFVVTAKISTTVEAVLINNFYRGDDTAFTDYITAPNLSNFTSGAPTSALVQVYNTKRWFYPGGIYGDTESGSATITNVKDMYGNPATDKLRVGDQLAGGQVMGTASFDEELNTKLMQFFNVMTVASIVNGTTITIDQTPEVSGVGVQLFNVL